MAAKSKSTRAAHISQSCEEILQMMTGDGMTVREKAILGLAVTNASCLGLDTSDPNFAFAIAEFIKSGAYKELPKLDASTSAFDDAINAAYAARGAALSKH